MLHRGIYNIDGENKEQFHWSWKNAMKKLLGITKEYTTGDKVIAWAYFIYTFIYSFICTFLIVLVWNFFSPWKNAWWSQYFFIVYLVIPGIMAFISAFWLGTGGVIDLFRLFRDLEARSVDDLDNGVVDGDVSIVDKKKFEEREKEKIIEINKQKEQKDSQK